MIRSMLKWIGAALLLCVVIYVAVLFVLHGGSPDFISIDSCLDSGGRWDHGRRVCVH